MWCQIHPYPHTLILTCSPAILSSHSSGNLLQPSISSSSYFFVVNECRVDSNSSQQWPLQGQAEVLLDFLEWATSRIPPVGIPPLLCPQPTLILYSQSKLVHTNKLRVGHCKHSRTHIVSFSWFISWPSLSEH